MKYKTTFRLLIKFLGVWMFVQGISGLVAMLGMVIVQFATQPAGLPSMSWMYTSNLLSPACNLVLGAYLFFTGKWVVDRAIPGNRPYCHECGYELTANASQHCPECGTATPLVG